MLNKLLFTILAAMTLTLAGMTASLAGQGDNCADGTNVCECDGDGHSYSYGYGHKNGDGNGNGDGDGDGDGDRDRDRDRDGSCMADDAESSAAPADLTTDELYWLNFIHEEERMARDGYLVLGDLWNLLIFENVAVAEQKHMDAMENLFDCFNLSYPVTNVADTLSISELQTWFDLLLAEGMGSMMNGLNSGAAIEETQIANIQLAKGATGNMDIVSTYESLQCASRNHLRAFVRQIEINGGLYTPVILTPEEFLQIISSPMEQNCGGNKKGQGDS